MSVFAMASPPRTAAEAQHQQHTALLGGWLFLVFVLIMVASVIHPVWRTKWRWGRRRPGAPMSAFGRAAWICCFLLWTLVCFGEGYGVVPVSKSGRVLFVAVGILFAAAIYDACYFQGRQK